LEPKKNIPNLIKSFFYLLQEQPDIELVIGGKKSWYYEDIFQTVKKLGIENRVRFLNYVPSEDLPLLYNAAEIFVFPSLYEGFGLPPLEAMKCGTPVITSNVSSLPEVMGERGMMVDPDDPVALCEAMKKIILDRSFQEEQVKYSLERSRQFSWEKTAEMTLDVYEKVMGK
jgi:glycosyltransferase involved in cell wall biosynthesis